MKTARQVPALLVSLAVCYGVAAIGGLASIDASDYYLQLQRPSWAPPGWIFGPVWSVLYTMMAVAAWRVWCAGGSVNARPALRLFAVHLFFNALWSWLFFAWHLGGLALVDIALMWTTLLVTIVAFRRWSPAAAWLLAPYLAWVSFAAVLNYVVWQANPLRL